MAVATTKGNQSCGRVASVAVWHKLLNNLYGAERTFSLKFANVFKVRDNSQRDDYSSEFICLLGMQNATTLPRHSPSHSLAAYLPLSDVCVCVQMTTAMWESTQKYFEACNFRNVSTYTQKGKARK